MKITVMPVIVDVQTGYRIEYFGRIGQRIWFIVYHTGRLPKRKDHTSGYRLLMGSKFKLEQVGISEFSRTRGGSKSITWIKTEKGNFYFPTPQSQGNFTQGNKERKINLIYPILYPIPSSYYGPLKQG